MMYRPITQAIKSNPIFTASSFWGIFPFRVIGNELKVDKLIFLYSLVITSCYTVVYPCLFWISSSDVRDEVIQEGKAFSYFFTFCCSSVLSFSFLLYSICFYANRNAFGETVNSLDALERFFNKLGVKMKKRPIQKRVVSKALYAPFVCVIFFYAADDSLTTIIIVTWYIILLMGSTLICAQFNCFVDTVREYFQSSSKFLVGMKHQVSFVNLKSLEKLVDSLGRLVATSNKINAIYTQQLLHPTIHLYQIYINFNSNDGRKYITGDVLMTLYHLFLVWRLTYSAAQTNQKGKLKLHILMKNEVVLTAYGFFKLDYTLIHSIIASATTYLVILIQFGEPPNLDQHPTPTAMANLTTSTLRTT